MTTTTQMALADERVRVGAAFLDNHQDVPRDWRHKIDKAQLTSNQNSVLDYVFADVSGRYTGLDYAYRTPFRTNFGDSYFQYDHGFSSGYDRRDRNVSARQLANAWVRHLESGEGESLQKELTARRAKQAAKVEEHQKAVAVAQDNLDSAVSVLAELTMVLAAFPAETVTDSVPDEVSVNQ